MNLEPVTTRLEVIRGIRSYFETQGFHEVITPVLNTSLPLEPTLYSFKTTWKTSDKNQPLFLTISPESGLKKMLAMGVGNCFSIGKSFRNLEGSGSTHNPEFLMLEWYRENADYGDIMLDVEKLIIFLNQRVGRRKLQETWLRLSLEDLMRQYAGVELESIVENAKLKNVMESKSYTTEAATWEQLFDQLFLNEVEPHLPKTPFFLVDFPARLSPLCTVNTKKPYLADRFEVYIDGMEIGNGNNENVDEKMVLRHFQDEDKARTRRGEATHPMDLQFLEALKQMRLRGKHYAGIGVGVDRLAMLYSGSTKIQEVEPFCIVY